MCTSAAFTAAQITPKQDSYTSSATATTNYGTAATLGVASTAASIQTTYIQFDLSQIPAGYTSAKIAKATLKLYVNSVATAGSFNVDYVNGSWTEKAITSSLAPALGTTIASNLALTTASANNYVEIDVTPAIGEWLNGTEPNDGVALVANSGLSATFDSKENTNQSHPAELDIVFTSGTNGTITGVTAGTGLQGGGTTGTVGLSLMKSCASKQVLQWNGSAWTCSSTGTGSVSSVGLTAPASDFTVSNAPVTSTGTLNFKWNVTPTSANAPNAIVKRDASGNFSADSIVATFLSAGSIGTGGLFSATASQNSSLVFAQNTATSGSGTYGVYGESDSPDQGAAGVFGFAPMTGGTSTSGVLGTSASAYGQGVLGTNTNDSAGPTFGGAAVEGVAVGINAAGIYGIVSSASGLSPSRVSTFANFGVGVWGDTGQQYDYGVFGTAADGYAGWFENDSASGLTPLTAVSDNASSLPFVASNRATANYCYVDGQGNLNCSGAKHAVVPIDAGRRTVALSAIESPENWFEDFGSARLSGGVATVALEPDFAQTVNTGVEYHVFLTPRGECEGLYVANTTASGFEVRELHHGSSSVIFDYRIVALRKNFENIRLEDHTKEMGMVKAMQAKKGKTASQPRVEVGSMLTHPKPALAAKKR
jgi:hypothetical protein